MSDQEQKNEASKGCKSCLIGRIFCIIIIIFIFCALGFGYRQLKLTNTKIADLQNTLQQYKVDKGTQEELLVNIQKEFQAYQKSNKSIVFSLLEARSIVKTVAINLTVNKNVVSAINLLKIANEEIPNDPTLTEVHQAINNDINSLNAISKVDLVGMVLQLDALSKSIENLPVINNELTPVMKVTTVAELSVNEPKQSWWRRLWTNSLAKLQNIIIIKRRDVPFEPIFSRQEEILVKQMIQLSLNRAQNAILTRQNQIYHNAIQSSLILINEYATNKNIPDSVNQELNKLQSVDIDPPLPNLAGSLQAINKTISQLSEEAQ